MIEGIAPYAPVRPAKGQMAALRADDLKMERVLWSEKIYLVPRNDGRILAGRQSSTPVSTSGPPPVHRENSFSRHRSRTGLANARIEETWQACGRILPITFPYSDRPTSMAC